MILLNITNIPVMPIMTKPETVGELFASLTVGQKAGVITLFATYAVMITLALKGKLPWDTSVDDFIEEAKEKENVVKATRRTLLMRDTEGQGNLKDRQYTGCYDFFINGKKKSTTVTLLGDSPPRVIDIYTTQLITEESNTCLRTRAGLRSRT